MKLSYPKITFIPGGKITNRIKLEKGRVPEVELTELGICYPVFYDFDKAYQKQIEAGIKPMPQPRTVFVPMHQIREIVVDDESLAEFASGKGKKKGKKNKDELPF